MRQEESITQSQTRDSVKIKRSLQRFRNREEGEGEKKKVDGCRWWRLLKNTRIQWRGKKNEKEKRERKRGFALFLIFLMVLCHFENLIRSTFRRSLNFPPPSGRKFYFGLCKKGHHMLEAYVACIRSITRNG